MSEDAAPRSTPAERGASHGMGSGGRRSTARVVLLVLAVEKTIQHVVVSYAFAVDLDGIRSSVAVPYVPLMIVGLVIGTLFALGAYAVFLGRRAGYQLLAVGAAVDIVGEMVAQGTLAIDVTVSFVVAVIILLLVLGTRRSWPET